MLLEKKVQKNSFKKKVKTKQPEERTRLKGDDHEPSILLDLLNLESSKGR